MVTNRQELDEMFAWCEHNVCVHGNTPGHGTLKHVCPMEILQDTGGKGAPVRHSTDESDKHWVEGAKAKRTQNDYHFIFYVCVFINHAELVQVVVRAVVIHEKCGVRRFYKGRRGAYRGTEMVSWDLGVSYIRLA